MSPPIAELSFTVSQYTFMVKKSNTDIVSKEIKKIKDIKFQLLSKPFRLEVLKQLNQKFSLATYVIS